MTFIKSVSGFRGTIGGFPGDNLTPFDLVACTASFANVLLEKNSRIKVVIGRDGRISGEIVNGIVINTLRSMGVDVIDLGHAATPAVEMAVPYYDADGGIILTASHNPKEWNALKLLNEEGEFISPETGRRIIEEMEQNNFNFAPVGSLGSLEETFGFEKIHAEQIIQLPLVRDQKIIDRRFKVVVDVINSIGSIAIPPLLDALQVDYILINEAMTGDFNHNPEPLPNHLQDLSASVIKHEADLGIAVDPDADRLVFVNEDGSFFGEEYTLVAIADYILRHEGGNTVSNLSSSRALRDVTQKAGFNYYASKVGEVHVVAKMKEVQAVIGGEGNGGIIYPDLHYGRDALVGIALFLSHLVEYGGPASSLRNKYPDYTMVKDRIELDPDWDVDKLLTKIPEFYREGKISTEDGVKVDLEKGWIHLRKSNTEPIIRVYAEARDRDTAQAQIDTMKNHFLKFTNSL